jgi:hypothetical protein
MMEDPIVFGLALKIMKKTRRKNLVWLVLVEIIFLSIFSCLCLLDTWTVVFS